MSTGNLRFCLVMVVLLMLLATRVYAEPVGQITVGGTTYVIVPLTDASKPAARFKLGGKTYALVAAPPAVKPTTAPASQPATQPAAKSTSRPSRVTTSVPADVTLTPAAKLSIEPGKVYERLSLTGTQTITLAAGQAVTFRHCRIDGGGNPYGFRCDQNAGRLIIEQCEIFNVSSAALYGRNFDCLSSYLHRSAGDGFKPIENALIQGNYVAELGWQSPTAHADGVQIRGGRNIRITGNFFDLPNDLPDCHANSALFLQLSARDVTFDGNFCLGGNFPVHAYADDGGGRNVNIHRNTFYTGSARYGFGSIGKDVVWTDNIDETGKAVRPGDK